ncbi:pepsin-like aspartyl protease [Shewanella sp. Isolate11]|uniref:pepsin-like aspartyl protease n=1 Tax=Shewanella sp. Isolate11 TaxID=2908530 RepID=UPI001EFDAFA9|nr:pepsin-like aspartyl protease [Shewanella sp. Isolate11]MCG9697717.1 pepsin-like aspartyl protease [Shewanella sp. Isolate11]
MSSTTPSPRTLKVPLVNVYAKGGYSAQLRFGAQKQPLNLILDTGSSTLVVSGSDYVEENDSALTPTSFAQEVLYGIGGWDGPVVYTRVGIREDEIDFDIHDAHVPYAHNPIVLAQCPVAVVSSLQQETSFADADGILGLAYHSLNKAYDLKDYFNHYGIVPALTYPWPFDEEIHLCSQHFSPIISDEGQHLVGDNTTLDEHNWHQQSEGSFNSDDLRQFKRFLKRQPTSDLSPYFNALTQQGLTQNKFAFYGQRSSIHVASHEVITANSANEFAFLGQDPLNQGWLILGGGEEHTELYQGEFKTICVTENKYYNVHLIGLAIGDNPMIESQLTQSLQSTPSPQDVESLAQSNQHTHGVTINSKMRGQSNAIVDTGASAIVLTEYLFEQMKVQLKAINPQFIDLIDPFGEIAFQQQGIDMSQLQLQDWPDLHFIFVGQANAVDNQAEQICLTVTAEHYWQINSPAPEKACFKILSQLPGWPDQSILGLPLMSGYYVIFDRSAYQKGIIRFAQQKRAPTLETY